MTPRNDNQYRLPFGAVEADAKAVFVAKLAAVSPDVAGVSDAVWANLTQLLESLHFFADRDPKRYAQPSPDALQANADMSRSVIGRTIKAGRELGLLSTERPRQRRGQKRSPDRVWIHHPELDRLVERSRDARRGSDAPASAAGGITRDQVGTGGIRWEHIKETSSPPSLTPSNPPPIPAQAPPGASPHGVDIDVEAPGGWGEVLKTLEELDVSGREAAVRQARARGATPADAGRVIAVYLAEQTPAPPAWGPGGLCTAIKRCRPGTEPSFPPPADEHLAAVKREQAEATRQQQAAADRQRAAERATREREQAAKRAEYERLRAIAQTVGESAIVEWAAELDPYSRDIVEGDPFGWLAITTFADRLLARQPVTV